MIELGDNSFDESALIERYPNARRILMGGLFLSHCGLDADLIRDEIVSPILLKRFGDGLFFFNKKSGGLAYRDLILGALNLCDKFLVVVSKNSKGHDWVQAELDWALNHKRPIISLSIDDTKPWELDRRLERSIWPFNGPDHQHIAWGTKSSLKLERALDRLLVRYPYQRASQS